MKKLSKFILAGCSTLFCLNVTALPVPKLPNQDDPTTFVGPTLKGRYTNSLTENTAYSLLGEAGFKNFRIGGTVGWRLSLNQRIKFSAEYLWQNISYSFFNADSDQWMNQGAIGAGYQYNFLGYAFDPAFDLNAYYSHAPSKSLNTKRGVYVNNLGNRRTFVDERRIAGSNAGGIAPGISFTPWIGGRLGLELNYDNVRYDKTFSPSENADGFGGTARLLHSITEYFFVGLSAAVRQPFNNYTARVGWINIPYYGGAWTLGFDGGYTIGKETLPNTWNFGITFDYLLQPCPLPVPLNLKGDYKGEATVIPVDDGFVPWTAQPAVYMPQVLAVADERVTTGCLDGTPPINIATIPNQTIGGTVDIPTAQAFSGTNLTFSVASTAIAPNAVTIDPVTGVVTVTAVIGTFEVTVTASNVCGAASTTFVVGTIT